MVFLVPHDYFGNSTSFGLKIIPKGQFKVPKKVKEFCSFATFDKKPHFFRESLDVLHKTSTFCGNNMCGLGGGLFRSCPLRKPGVHVPGCGWSKVHCSPVHLVVSAGSRVQFLWVQLPLSAGSRVQFFVVHRKENTKRCPANPTGFA